MEPQTAAVAEPDTSLAAHMLAEAEPPPAPAAEPVVAEPAAPAESVTAEAEAASAEPDAAVSEAARLLRKSRSEERKAKIHAEIAEGVKERETVREEIRRLRAEREQLARQEPAHTPAATSASADPEPILDSFEDFNSFMAANREWMLREAERRAQTRHQELARQSADAAEAQILIDKGKAALERYSDYKAVIEPVIERFNADPARAADVAAFVAQSSVGAELFYRLSKDPAATEAVLTAKTPFALARELARLETQLSQPTPAAFPKTNASPPPSHTVGGGASTAALDTRKGVSTADHIRIEETELAERRRRGLRY